MAAGEAHRLTSVYVEYTLRSNLPPEQHAKRKCCNLTNLDSPDSVSSETCSSPEECAKHYLSTLDENERKLCMLVAEKSSTAPESADISDLTQYCFSKKNFRANDLENLLSTIFCGIFSNGISAGKVIGCMSLCGVAAVLAAEIGIPCNNIPAAFQRFYAKELQDYFPEGSKGLKYYVLGQTDVSVWEKRVMPMFKTFLAQTCAVVLEHIVVMIYEEVTV